MVAHVDTSDKLYVVPTLNGSAEKKRLKLNVPNQNSDARKTSIRIIRNPPPRLGTTWRQFCNETSLAGFNHLNLENNPLRKAFWHVIIAIFAAITLYMLVRIVQSYIENPVKVTIDKVYMAEMQFPEVIICNTMNYRVSAVRPLSAMHIALSRIYESVRPDEGLVRRDPQIRAVLENTTDSRSFLQAAAHQAEDMIISCTWLNSNVSCKNDFLTVVTDIGVCYSFNHNVSEPKMVSHSGNNFGLELILNIGTYEAMNGPYNTYGARIAFVKPGYARTMRRSVNALLGEYTSIGLVAKTLLRDDSLCDRSAKLKYNNSTYTKEFCAVDYAISDVKEKCNCYPYIIDSSFEDNATLSQCNLAQHFSCAQSIIDQPPQRTAQECPTECDSYSFVPTVSTAKVAWDRVRSKVSMRDRNQIEENLITALEISKRYRPSDNDSTVQFFLNLRIAVTGASDFIAIANNITNPLLQIPPNNGAPSFASNFEGFLTKVYNESLRQINESLAMLNETLEITFDALDNESYVGYLLGSRNASDIKTEGQNLIFPTDVFNVNEGQLYLNTLPKVVEQLEKISKAKEQLRKGVLEGFYVGQQTILTAEDVRILNGSVQSFLAILFSEQLENRTTAALQIPVQFGHTELKKGVSSKENHSEPVLLDVVICHLILYSSPNSEAAISHQIARYTDTIPANAVDPAQQRSICKVLLCRAFNSGNDACKITAERKRQMIRQLRSVVSNSLNRSMIQFEEAKEQMDQFLEHVNGKVLAQYASAVDAADRYAKDSSQIAKDFESGLFPPMPDLPLLLANMTAYVVSMVSYEDFSKTIINYFSQLFIEPVFLFNFAAAKTRVQETLKRLDAMELALAQLHNISVTIVHAKSVADAIASVVADANHTIAGNGVYAVAAGSLLWHNNTTEAIFKSVELIKEFRSRLQPLGEAITQHSGSVKTTFDQLASDCKEFIASSVTNAEFYGRNFLVVDVHMDEISEEIVQQQQAFEFSNFIGDLGGAASFWFGVCMVNFVELIDYSFIYLFQFILSFYNKLFNRGRQNSGGGGGENTTVKENGVVSNNGELVVHLPDGDTGDVIVEEVEEAS